MTYTSDASIFVAAAEGNVSRVKELLEQKIDLSAPDFQGRLALHYAFSLPMLCEPVLIKNKLTIANDLIAHAALMLRHRDNAGDTPLHLMASDDRFHDLLKWIVDTKPELGLITNNFGEYPIHVAIMNKQKHSQETLLAYFAKKADMIKYGGPLLHHAVKANNIAMLRELISTYKIDINVLNDDLQTPLDSALAFHFTDMVDYLKEHGARSSHAQANF